MAYASIEPFGGLVEDYRAGLAPAMYRNLKRPEGTEVIMPLELFPWRAVEDERPPETREELERRIKRDLLGEGNG